MVGDGQSDPHLEPAEGLRTAEFQAAAVVCDHVADDQWQLEELAKVLRKARVIVGSDGLPREVLAGLFVESASTVEAAVAEALTRYGGAARVAVIPKGPYVLARVAD